MEIEKLKEQLLNELVNKQRYLLNTKQTGEDGSWLNNGKNKVTTLSLSKSIEEGLRISLIEVSKKLGINQEELRNEKVEKIKEIIDNKVDHLIKSERELKNIVYKLELELIQKLKNLRKNHLEEHSKLVYWNKGKGWNERIRQLEDKIQLNLEEKKELRSLTDKIVEESKKVIEEFKIVGVQGNQMDSEWYIFNETLKKIENCKDKLWEHQLQEESKLNLEAKIEQPPKNKFWKTSFFVKKS